MNRHTPQPACYVQDPALVTPRAPGFWDDGRSCGTAGSRRLWKLALQHTPGCRGCERARRAATFWRTA